MEEKLASNKDNHFKEFCHKGNRNQVEFDLDVKSEEVICVLDWKNNIIFVLIQ